LLKHLSSAPVGVDAPEYTASRELADRALEWIARADVMLSKCTMLEDSPETKKSSKNNSTSSDKQTPSKAGEVNDADQVKVKETADVEAKVADRKGQNDNGEAVHAKMEDDAMEDIKEDEENDQERALEYDQSIFSRWFEDVVKVDLSAPAPKRKSKQSTDRRKILAEAAKEAKNTEETATEAVSTLTLTNLPPAGQDESTLSRDSGDSTVVTPSRSASESASSSVQSVEQPSETAASVVSAAPTKSDEAVASASNKVMVPAPPASDSGQEALHDQSAGDVTVPPVAVSVPLEAIEDGPPTPSDATSSGTKRARTASIQFPEKKSGPGRGRKKIKRTLSPSSLKDQEESSRPSRAARVEKKATEQEAKAAKEAEREAAGKFDLYPELRDAEARAVLRGENIRRTGFRKQQVRNADDCNNLLRDGMCLAVEFDQRKLVEDRVRLLLCLAKAELILVSNQLSHPLHPVGKLNRRSQKEILIVHTELLRARVDCFRDSVPEQNDVWPRFKLFVSLLQAWTHKTLFLLSQSCTLEQLNELKHTAERCFPLVNTEARKELDKRVSAVEKWIPREKKDLREKERLDKLSELAMARYNECKKTRSEFTPAIEQRVDRAEKWKQRLQKAIEAKTDASFEPTIKNLLLEVKTEELFLDEKYIQDAQSYSELHCLCRSRYEEGSDMICCDTCDEWYHPTCVGLTVKQYEDAKDPNWRFKCPQCCRNTNVKYSYGYIEGFHDPREALAHGVNSEKLTTTGNTPEEQAQVVATLDAIEKQTSILGRNKKKGAVSQTIKKAAAKEATKRATKAKLASKNMKKATGPIPTSFLTEEQLLQHVQADPVQPGSTAPDSAEAKSKKAETPNMAEARSKAMTLYATLLYDNLHEQVSPENSTVLWHLLNAFMNQQLDSKLHQEIIVSIKLVCGPNLLNESLPVVNRLYMAQMAVQQPKKKGPVGKKTDSSVIKRKRKRKPKGYPKTALTAYSCFQQDIKRRKKEAESKGDKSLSSLAITGKDQWGALSKEQRKPYEKQAADDKARYLKEMQAWKALHGDDPSDSEDDDANESKRKTSATATSANSSKTAGNNATSQAQLSTTKIPLVPKPTKGKLPPGMTSKRTSKQPSASALGYHHHPRGMTQVAAATSATTAASLSLGAAAVSAAGTIYGYWER
jgi:hypothetical protein